MIRRAAFALLLWAGAASAQPLTCSEVTQDGHRFAVCEVDLPAARAAGAELRLFLNDDHGAPYGHFSAVQSALPDEKALSFAMNAGMYHADRRPVGHYIEDGVQAMRVIPNAGPGNFGLLPNGVFCITATRADVIETLAYQAARPDCMHATQSGPMLVIGGALHPRFLEDSTSRYIRNGVGTSADGQRVVFAMSRGLVTFHEFGRLFRDVLNLPNALYFDGNISRLYAPPLGRDDGGFRMGPIVGLVVDQAK